MTEKKIKRTFCNMCHEETTNCQHGHGTDICCQCYEEHYDD